jgi:hypothetical protein
LARAEQRRLAASSARVVDRPSMKDDPGVMVVLMGHEARSM